MGFEVRPATISDAADMARVARAAFKSDALIGNLMPGIPEDVRSRKDTNWYEKSFREAHLFGVQVFKVVDTDSK